MAKDTAETSMDDILSSIKETVEGEVAKSDTAEENNVTEKNKKELNSQDIDDILDLTDIVNNDDEALVDVEAFSQNGESKKASVEKADQAEKNYDISEKGEALSPQSERDDFDVDIDALMAEVSEESAESEQSVQEVLDDDIDQQKQPLTDDVDENASDENLDIDAAIAAQVAAKEAATTGEGEASLDVKDSEMSEKSTLPPEGAKRIALRTVPGPTGLQVGFPAEILAEALRPLVTDWLEENLADIVERLVKEELSKLADR